MGTKITICSGCRAGDGPALGPGLADRLRGLVGPGISVAMTDCMIVCGQPVTVSVRATGKAAYLFSGVDPVAMAENIATFAALFDATPDGIVDDVRACGDLRFRLLGRIPA